MLFESYIRKKELEDYNNNIEKYSEKYAELKILGEINGFPIHQLTINPKGSKGVFFVAGIHGNEVGGPYGVLEFLKQKMRIRENLRVDIIPLANPTGFIKNTRENDNEVNLNRSFYEKRLCEECKLIWNSVVDTNPEYLHTLHENTELKRFYLYYTHHKDLAVNLREVGRKHFSICEDQQICGDKLNEGLISLPHTNKNTLEDRALDELSIPYIITKTPGKLTLISRSKCNSDIIKHVIHNI